MGADDIENWEAPKLLHEYCPHGEIIFFIQWFKLIEVWYWTGMPGFDKGGSPIIVVPFAGMDMYGVLHAVSRSDMLRYTLQQLEKYMKIAYQQSITHGPEARQFIVIFDMQDFYLKQYAWRPGKFQFFFFHLHVFEI